MGANHRSLILFLESCKSKHTAKAYKYYLDKFIQFNNLEAENYNAVLKVGESELQNMIADWIIHLKKTKSPNTLTPMVFGVKSFFESNEIELKWNRLQKLIPQKTKASGRGAYSKEQIRTMLDVSTDLRSKALIHFLAASGMRIGAVPDLKIKHIKPYDNCYMVTVYAGALEEYVTFLTPEARVSLDNYLGKRQQDGEKLNDDSPLFITKEKRIKPCDRATLQEIIRRSLIKAGLRRNKQGHRYHIQIDHGFRKFFDAAVKEAAGIILSYAEMLMGHAVTISLDNNYLEAKPDKLFKEYQKAVINLTIDDKAKLQIEKEQAEAKLSEIENVKAQMKEMQNELAIQKMINRMNEHYLRTGKKPEIVDRGDKVDIKYTPPTEGWDFDGIFDQDQKT